MEWWKQAELLEVEMKSWLLLRHQQANDVLEVVVAAAAAVVAVQLVQKI